MYLLAMRHSRKTMTRRIISVFLLTLLLHNAICTLERIHSDSDQVICTGDLSCTLSSDNPEYISPNEPTDALCMPGDMEEVTHPVLVPSNMRTQTILRCKGDDCFPCVQVEVDIYAAFLTASEDVEDDCEDYYDCSEDSDDSSDCEYQNLNTLNDENGPFVCAYVFIPHYSKFYCVMAKVSVPLSSISLSHKQDRVKMGSLTFRCFNASPNSDVNLTVYTVPRYQDVINGTHHVPGCKTFRFIEEVKQCSVPSMNVSFGEELSVGIVNGSRNHSYNLSLFDASRLTTYVVEGDKRLSIPEEFMVPCLCIQVWWSDLTDAVREEYCPLRNSTDPELEENVWKESNFSVTVENGAMLYTFKAPCHVSVEFSLCWNYSHRSHCQELPFSQKTNTNVEMQVVKGVQFDPSLCVQVKSNDKIRHVKCVPDQGPRNKVTEEVVLLASRHPQENAFSLCLMENHSCTQLYNTTHRMLSSDYLEQSIVLSYMSNHCKKIWSDGENRDVFVCSVERRHNWIAFAVIGLYCMVFLVIVTKTPVTKWLKSATSYKPVGEIFKDRRVWIVYSPDSQPYIDLVHVFAVSLRKLQLNVVLDRWHLSEMCTIDPISWYHKQRSLVFQENGIIVLLFDEGALERYKEWIDKESPRRLLSSDPYCSFGSALSCIHADFVDGSAEERYVVAAFSQVKIPFIYDDYPLFRLPSKMKDLLRKLAGSHQGKLRKTQLDKLSRQITKKLQKPMKEYQRTNDLQRRPSRPGSETISMDSNEAFLMKEHWVV